LLAHGQWFSPGTPASSTTKTGRHDIAKILLKVALNTKKINQSINGSACTKPGKCEVMCHCPWSVVFSPGTPASFTTKNWSS